MCPISPPSETSSSYSSHHSQIRLIVDHYLQDLPVHHLLHHWIALQGIYQWLHVAIVPDYASVIAHLANYYGLSRWRKVHNNIQPLHPSNFPQPLPLLQYLQRLFLPNHHHLLEAYILKLQRWIMVEFRDIDLPLVLFKQLIHTRVLVYLYLYIVLYL